MKIFGTQNPLPTVDYLLAPGQFQAGHNFLTFTKGLEKPFQNVRSNARPLGYNMKDHLLRRIAGLNDQVPSWYQKTNVRKQKAKQDGQFRGRAEHGGKIGGQL
jgi:hypothetical protein